MSAAQHRSTDHHSLIGALPVDTQKCFFRHLDARSLLACRVVCREWGSWASSEEAWTSVYCAVWRRGAPLPKGVEVDETSAMEMYKRRYCELGRGSDIDAEVRWFRRPDHAFDAVNNMAQQELWWFNQSISAIRSKQPLRPILCLQECCKSVLYFEARVFGGSSVGLMNRSLHRGWKSSHIGWRNRSYGYHSDDGQFYWNDGAPETYGGIYHPFAEAYGHRDGQRAHQTVGCGFDIEQQEVFFTLDGRMLGVAKAGVPVDDYYGAVALHDEGDSVMINFGSLPFEFDIEAFCVRAASP